MGEDGNLVQDELRRAEKGGWVSVEKSILRTARENVTVFILLSS